MSSFTRTSKATSGKTHRAIVFHEANGYERVLDASTDEILAASCLLILRERYKNPIWAYKPEIKTLTEDERDFLDYWENEHKDLPALLYKFGKRTYERLQDRIAEDADPDWNWYYSVEDLLKIPQDRAVAYKVSYRGRYIPTAYYLILKRREFPNESFALIEALN